MAALSTGGFTSESLYPITAESIKPNVTKEVELSVSDNSSSLATSVTDAFEDGMPLANVTIMGVASARNAGVDSMDRVGKGSV